MKIMFNLLTLSAIFSIPEQRAIRKTYIVDIVRALHEL